MGSEEVETRANEVESTYKVISYPGPDLPAQYKNMVFSKWLRSLRFGNDYFKIIDSDAYFSSYHVYIAALLLKPDAVVRLAVLSDDYDVVLGFSVARGTVLDYVHVQRDYRRQGIGSSLIPDGTTIVTHLTKNGMSLWTSYLPTAKFNPFI